MYATPLTPDAIAFGQIAWIATRATIVGDDLHDRHRRVRRGTDRRDRPRDPGRDADGARVRGADRRLHVDPARHDVVQRDLAVRDHARCSCSRARSSRSTSCRRRSSWIAWLLPLWHGVDLAAVAVARHVWEDPLLAIAHVVILRAVAIGGLVAMFVMFRRQLAQ